jgi:glycosyltransferase involved in cell wall biosynthesis
MSVKIEGMMRVKNEERWIREAVDSLFGGLCRSVHVLDDSSTDSTRHKLENHSLVFTHRSPFSGLDEQRDKNYLLGLTLQNRPDWIIHIDGDEVIDQGAAEIIRHYAETCSPEVQAFVFKVDYLWDRSNQYRVDGRYNTFWRGSMFRVKGLTRGFKSTAWGNGANLHCLNIPAGITNAIQVPVRLKHYGYMDRVDRLKKWEYYNRVDPGNQVEDGYRHMILGDREDLPGEMVTKWAGPLTLRPWTPGMKVEIPQ